MKCSIWSCKFTTNTNLIEKNGKILYLKKIIKYFETIYKNG